MSAAMIVAIALALAAALAMVRIGRRRPGLLALQPAIALALYFTLFPPPVATRAGALVLATADTTAAQVGAWRGQAIVLALPEAPPLADVARVPDLATALRRYPAQAQLRVLGAGLVARDRDATRGRALAFDPPAPARGLVELHAPQTVTVGAQWRVTGRIQALPDARLELLDPSGRAIARARADRDGRFELPGVAVVEGRMAYTLVLRDARARRLERVALPLQVRAGTASRVWLLAGGPNPELKYLRRWAKDAGARPHVQASLGGGLRLGDRPLPFDAATLRGFDLVVLDERAWRELGPSRRAILREAVASGLGLLLRLTGPLSAAERGELRALGFELAADAGATSVRLDAGDGPVLTRQALRVRAADGVPLLRDAGGTPLALWRGHGAGRIGLWWLGDSFRLVLAGQPATHGRIWSEALATLGRATGKPAPTLDSEDPRPQQRLVVCGVPAGASMLAPDGERSDLLVDPGSGSRRCAAYWPRRPGWHRVEGATAPLEVLVRGVGELPGVRAQDLRDQTLRLATPATDAAQARDSAPGRRWPWFLAWLLASALGWWLERRGRRGETRD